MSKKVIIIGAGFSGLASAALLSKYGYKVTVLEKNKSVGGVAQIFKKKGFTFDMGPSWYLMPEIFENYFSLFKKKPADFYSLKRLSPSYRVFTNNRKRFDIFPNVNKNLATFETLEKNSSISLKKYLTQSKLIYEAATQFLMFNKLPSLSYLIRLRTILLKLILLNIRKFTVSYFSTPLLNQLLTFHSVFLGGSPTNIPSFYSLFAHIDFNLGVYYPLGGFSKVSQAILKLAKENKSSIKLSTTVKKIIIKNGRAIGVVLTDRQKVYADIIVSSADLAYTETSLIPTSFQTYPKKYWDKKTFSPSCFILLLGLGKKIKILKHHNFFFEDNWDKHFNQIFNSPSLPDNPSFYICCPTKTDKTLAPKSNEILFILVPISPLIKDSETIRKKYTFKIIYKLSNILKQDLSPHIKVLSAYSINDFKSDYNSYFGSAFGITHTLMQSSLFRPSHKSKKVKNLYFTGQYTQPGIGVPTALVSAQLLLNKILNDNKI